MVHNLTSESMTLYVSYSIDFIPDNFTGGGGNASGAADLDGRRQRQQLSGLRRAAQLGGRDGRFIYPDDAANPYPNGRPQPLAGRPRRRARLNRGPRPRRRPRDRPLPATDRRRLRRPRCGSCDRRAAAGLPRPCPVGVRQPGPSLPLRRQVLGAGGPGLLGRQHDGDEPDWRVAVHQGDILEVNTTYETRLGAWYESMGIMVVWMADGGGGTDPYATKVDLPGEVTHGHLPENDFHGGGPSRPAGPAQPAVRRLHDRRARDRRLRLQQGDLRALDPNNRPPVVKQGQSLTFKLGKGDSSQEIWHSLTSCAAPCNKSTGIAYPIPDGVFQFDSGQLGRYRRPSSGRPGRRRRPCRPAPTPTSAGSTRSMRGASASYG